MHDQKQHEVWYIKLWSLKMTREHLHCKCNGIHDLPVFPNMKEVFPLEYDFRKKNVSNEKMNYHFEIKNCL